MVCRRSGVPPFPSSEVLSGMHRFRRGDVVHRSSLCGFGDRLGLSQFERAVGRLPVARVGHGIQLKTIE